ncbi:hypothetical protein E6P09_12425 [Haloferax mediterranei ATCC 33500]|uniref:Uncharacterized protein n=1 Tax=Haloferax mediterranei (strain ATCC 33500 / DSM 1411 / JCM 8866 / NBRC 14739 / NCIMB 2177 / R-4) TaxID=523841 RepID=I3R8I2_HALMT|nr:hypothetical protein [Haloferax mediterranei]AFK20542.1 hypothetical protein HFX_2872 [Haloferax mediterranei ATCC 33500]AHZ23899.1 hypothetical protein BM92_15155 [Haloferax mediterranei ATCC 33500]ELZ98324.1 hypothetical protein C439_16105 [Haloferax mediterranei ATCC 33500]MDX5986703.1 hypothetical protein [Haloferax mediterranei ATCC 33500]QCQ76030.1 hypothetical protein E6P09_12425 [Haloferax mediterranei ATCC 33500]
MTGYYDYILGLIPLALIGITGSLVVVGLQLTMAVPMAAGVAALLTGHALFVNGPSSSSPSTPIHRLDEHTGPADATSSPSVLDAD